MRGPDHKQSSLFSYTNIEDRIAVDHPLRRVKVMADMVLHSMSPTFDSLYAEGGRPSIAPERLLRALLLQCLFSIRSERALIEHLDFNMMFRWFVGLSQDEPVWDHSSFSANRDRLLKESVMREFFGGVVAIAEWAELISDEHFSVDGSLLRAWASHKSLAARDGSDEPPGPDQGRNPEVDFRGKKRTNKTHVSRTDPDALLATNAAGIVPYVSGLRTVDMLGLNDRETARDGYLIPLMARHNVSGVANKGTNGAAVGGWTEIKTLFHVKTAGSYLLGFAAALNYSIDQLNPDASALAVPALQTQI